MVGDHAPSYLKWAGTRQTSCRSLAIRAYAPRSPLAAARMVMMSMWILGKWSISKIASRFTDILSSAVKHGHKGVLAHKSCAGKLLCFFDSIYFSTAIISFMLRLGCRRLMSSIMYSCELGQRNLPATPAPSIVRQLSITYTDVL